MTPEQRAVIEQALEVLQELDGIDTETECVTIDVGNVITALTAALEQPAQQEPVAYWRNMAYANLGAVRDKMPLEQVTAVQDWLLGIYTSRPQAREWVRLTDEELLELQDQNWVECEGGGYDWNTFEFARAIEAKLREKNT